MITLTIPRFPVNPNDPQQVEEGFRQAMPHPIAQNNWAKEYPYAPQVQFRIYHTDTHLMLRFEVAERYTLAAVTQDQGEVWTDSCVEFFLALDSSGYYNFEANSIGTLLLAFRKERPDPTYASTEVMASVQRRPTLPATPFAEREGDNRWSLTLAIPASALFRHELTSWSGVKARMNLYKCGDKLSHPHFLSWQPIATEEPDFHRPEFFSEVEFA